MWLVFFICKTVSFSECSCASQKMNTTRIKNGLITKQWRKAQFSFHFFFEWVESSLNRPLNWLKLIHGQFVKNKSTFIIFSFSFFFVCTKWSHMSHLLKRKEGKQMGDRKQMKWLCHSLKKLLTITEKLIWKEPTVKILRLYWGKSSKHILRLSYLRIWMNFIWKEGKEQIMRWFLLLWLHSMSFGQAVLLLWMCKHLHFYIREQQHCLWQQPLQCWLKWWLQRIHATRHM